MDGLAEDGVYDGIFRVTPTADVGAPGIPVDGEGPDVAGSYQGKVVATWDNFSREAQNAFDLPPSEDSDKNGLVDAREKANGVFGF